MSVSLSVASISCSVNITNDQTKHPITETSCSIGSLRKDKLYNYFKNLLSFVEKQKIKFLKIMLNRLAPCRKQHCCLLKSIFEPPQDKTNKMNFAPSKDSDQPGHLPSLIRIFAVRMKEPWVLSYPLSAQRRL